jgi:hypothetical protein
VEVWEKYEKEMEKLVDEVGEGKVSMEEFKRREKEMEQEKVRELGEEEEKKRSEKRCGKKWW